jgi:hypothetical protein
VSSYSVPSLEAFEALERRVANLEARLAETRMEPESAFVTIPEAALLLGCGYRPCDGYRKKTCGGDRCRRCHGTYRVVSRQRVDDLLSARILPRTKDGSRTLIRRTDVLAYLESNRGK